MTYYVVACTRERNPKKLVSAPSETVFVDNWFFKPSMRVSSIGVCEFTKDLHSAGVFTYKMANKVLAKVKERFKESSELDCHFYLDFHLERVISHQNWPFGDKVALEVTRN